MGRVAVAAIVSLWVVPVSVLVNRVVPEPYMDEIFHVPQAQQYCRGDFRSWDPMITTPPGLYYLSLAYVGILYPGMIFTRAISSFLDICSPAILRSVNGVLAVICSVLVYEIMTLLRPRVNNRNATACAVVLALYPLQWFFTFLYYTDAASLTMVLAMYLACLKKRYWISALLGALSVIVRQTNIVWMLFAACAGIIDVTLLSGKCHVKVADIDGSINDPSQPIQKNSNISSNLRRRKNNGAVDTDEIVRPTANILSSEMPGLLDEIKAILLTSWHMKWDISVQFVPFVMILMAFIAFIRWNGGIVLGAKDAHAVSPHFAQVMYFGLVSTLAMAPVHFSWGQATRIFESLWRNRPLSFLQVLLAICASFLSVHFFSMAHPYLLADNRHYPFYLWRKVINAHWSMKYLLVPLYTYSWLSIFSVLGRSQKRIWIVAYFLATAAVLVPAPLIEFRYYTYVSRSSSSTLLPSGVANDGQHYPALPFDAVEGVDQERPGAPIAVAVFQLSSTQTPRAPGLDHWLMISMWQALVNLILFMMLGGFVHVPFLEVFQIWLQSWLIHTEASKLVLAVPRGGLLQVKSFLMSFPASAIEHLVYFSVKYPIWNFVEVVLVLKCIYLI